MASVVGNNAFLKVKPSDLTDKAKQVQTRIDYMGELMGSMVNAMSTLHDNWQSTAGDSYQEKANILIQEIKESLENLSEYVSDLNTASGQYEEMESQIQGAVSNLEDPSSIFNV